jgi:hypothetical protein
MCAHAKYIARSDQLISIKYTCSLFPDAKTAVASQYSQTIINGTSNQLALDVGLYFHDWGSGTSVCGLVARGAVSVLVLQGMSFVASLVQMLVCTTMIAQL